MSSSDYESYEEGIKKPTNLEFEIYKTGLHIIDTKHPRYSKGFYPFEAVVCALPRIDYQIDYLLLETTFREFKIIIERKVYGKEKTKHVVYCIVEWDGGYFAGIGYYDHNHRETPKRYLTHLNQLKKKYKVF